MGEHSTEAIQERIGESVDVTKVTRGVYEVTAPDGSNRRYAKIWPQRSRSELKELISIDADIGLPEHRLIDGDPLILMMEPADGEKLTRTLLRGLLPGVWFMHRDQLIRAFRNLGRTIGRLHTRTHSHDRFLDPSSLLFAKYDVINGKTLASPLQEILGNAVVSRIEHQLSQLSAYKIPVSLVHGDLMLFHIYANRDGDITLIDFDAAKRVPCIDDLIRCG